MFNSDDNQGDNELNDAQKVKLFSTLNEFILLNKDNKPKIFNTQGEEIQNPRIKGYDKNSIGNLNHNHRYLLNF